MLPREALARALRLNKHGDIRPVWAMAPATTQEPWLKQADFIMRALDEQRYLILRPEEWEAVKDSLTTATTTVPNLSTFELSRMVEAFPLIDERRMADILVRFIKMRRG